MPLPTGLCPNSMSALKCLCWQVSEGWGVHGVRNRHPHQSQTVAVWRSGGESSPRGAHEPAWWVSVASLFPCTQNTADNTTAATSNQTLLQTPPSSQILLLKWLFFSCEQCSHIAILMWYGQQNSSVSVPTQSAYFITCWITCMYHVLE